MISRTFWETKYIYVTFEATLGITHVPTYIIFLNRFRIRLQIKNMYYIDTTEGSKIIILRRS